MVNKVLYIILYTELTRGYLPYISALALFVYV